MTPIYPKPSAHDVITGFFVPNEIDLNQGVANDFGTTIGIMAQDSSEGLTIECGNQSDAADSRASLFNYFLDLFGGESESNTANSCNSPQKLNNY